MKLHKSIQLKKTTRLFNNKYKYKIVILTKCASWFRGNNLDHVKERLNVSNSEKKLLWEEKITSTDKIFASKLCLTLSSLNDYLLRVESPLISIYSNDPKDIEKIAKIDAGQIKYVSYPDPSTEAALDDHKIITKNITHEFKVTMGRTRQSHTNFVEWCKDKEKVKLTKRAKSQLSKNNSWGGYYFYVQDEKTLIMVKMFVGGSIQAVEHCIKQ